MNDDINTLLFAMVPGGEATFAEIMRKDSETRQRLHDCTPLPWDTAKRHGEEV